MVITDGTRIKSNWLMFPVEKVGTDGVPPVHRAPHGVVGVVLIMIMILILSMEMVTD